MYMHGRHQAWAHTVPDRGQAGGRGERTGPIPSVRTLSSEMWALWLGKRAGPQARETLETPLPASVGLAPAAGPGPCVTRLASMAWASKGRDAVLDMVPGGLQQPVVVMAGVLAQGHSSWWWLSFDCAAAAGLRIGTAGSRCPGRKT